MQKLNINQNYNHLSQDSRAFYLKFRNDGKLIFNKSDFSSYTYSQNIDYDGNLILVGYYDNYNTLTKQDQ